MFGSAEAAPSASYTRYVILRSRVSILGPMFVNCSAFNTQTYAAKEAVPVTVTLFGVVGDVLEVVISTVRSSRSSGGVQVSSAAKYSARRSASAYVMTSLGSNAGSKITSAFVSVVPSGSNTIVSVLRYTVSFS